MQRPQYFISHLSAIIVYVDRNKHDVKIESNRLAPSENDSFQKILDTNYISGKLCTKVF